MKDQLPRCYAYDIECGSKPPFSARSKSAGSVCTRRSGEHANDSRPRRTGIVFRRSDLEYFPIPASWKHVARVSYATSLMRQGVLISDHRTSAQHALQLRHRQRFHRNRQSGSADSRRQRQAVRGTAARSGRAPAAPQAPISAHPPPRDRGGRPQANLHPAARCFPPDLRNRFPVADRQAVARNGSDPGALCARNFRRPAPSASSANWISCARWV